jgi:WD40 repeat protein
MNATVSKLLTPNRLVVFTLDVSPDGRILVVGQQGDAHSKLALGLWSLDENRLLTALISAEGVIPASARFSPSGRLLAYCDGEQRVVLRDLQSGDEDRVFRALLFAKWLSFAWNCDRLIAGGTRTQVWDAELGRVIWTLPVDPLPESASIEPSCCAISGDGNRVAASGVERGCIVVYDMTSGQIVKRLEHTLDNARSIAFDPNGRYIAAVASNLGVGLWDVDSGQALLPDLLNMRANFHWCVRFHPDGEHVGFGLWSGFVLLIRVSDGTYKVRQEQPAHRGRVRDLAFSRDGGRMVTGGDDGAILIWDLDKFP